MSAPLPGSEIRASREMITESSTWITPLREEVGRVIVGQTHLLDRLLIALLTNGHVLLEGVPGLAKTLALKTLASCISLQFKRLQFTPDMLPADIFGTMIYNPQDGAFRTSTGRYSAISSWRTRSIVRPRKSKARSWRPCRSASHARR